MIAVRSQQIADGVNRRPVLLVGYVGRQSADALQHVDGGIVAA